MTDALSDNVLPQDFYWRIFGHEFGQMFNLELNLAPAALRAAGAQFPYTGTIFPDATSTPDVLSSPASRT